MIKKKFTNKLFILKILFTNHSISMNNIKLISISKNKLINKRLESVNRVLHILLQILTSTNYFLE